MKQDLQGTALPTTRYGHRQVTNFNRAELTWEPLPGAAKYETGGIAVVLAAGVSAGIDYVKGLGIDKIRSHARMLTDRLQTELPPLGYTPLTPRRHRDADCRVRAEGRRGHEQGAARREDCRHDRRQRESPPAVGVGVQHPRGHRSRGRDARRARELVLALDRRARHAGPHRLACSGIGAWALTFHKEVTSMTRHNSALTLFGALALGLVLTVPTQGSEASLHTNYFTFDRSSVGLPAHQVVARHLHLRARRGDESRRHRGPQPGTDQGVLPGLDQYALNRPRQLRGSAITLGEARPGAPAPIAAWYPLIRRRGHGFIYR